MSQVAGGILCVVCQTTRDITLCDFPLTGRKAGQTCDRPVCRHHAMHEDPDTDYCPAPARLITGPVIARADGPASRGSASRGG